MKCKTCGGTLTLNWSQWQSAELPDYTGPEDYDRLDVLYECELGEVEIGGDREFYITCENDCDETGYRVVDDYRIEEAS